MILAFTAKLSVFVLEFSCAPFAAERPLGVARSNEGHHSNANRRSESPWDTERKFELNGARGSSGGLTLS